jgi:hypothetical protein
MYYRFLYDEEMVYSMIPDNSETMTHSGLDMLNCTMEEAKDFFEAIGVNHDVILIEMGLIDKSTLPGPPDDDFDEFNKDYKEKN